MEDTNNPFWGRGGDNKGQNTFGKMLMDLRTYLQGTSRPTQQHSNRNLYSKAVQKTNTQNVHRDIARNEYVYNSYPGPTERPQDVRIEEPTHFTQQNAATPTSQSGLPTAPNAWYTPQYMGPTSTCITPQYNSQPVQLSRPTSHPGNWHSPQGQWVFY